MDTNFSILATEQVNEKTVNIDIMSTREMLELINDEDNEVPHAVRSEIPNISKAVDIITAQIKRGGRLFYIGSGTSGRIGILDASECPPTFGTDPELVQGVIAGGSEAILRAVEGVEDDEELGRRIIGDRNISERDVIVGITASGRTPFVLGAVREAKKAGAVTVGISNCNESQIQQEADIAITPVVGPEVIMGSTRMKAGTSQKLILNMITTSVMIKLGKVYRNLMVDLQPGNEKLIDRAIRIIVNVTDLSHAKAREYLQESGFNAKTAIVMVKTKLGREAAERLLAVGDGVVAQAIKLHEGASV